MNTAKDISQLYNSLFELEAKFKKEAVYPIHKQLHFSERFSDIYEFLVSKVDCKGKTILDAGCGVGFGSFLFVKNQAKEVVGISVSIREIERANEIKTKLKIENCQFQLASFDEISTSFDLIFCVESLKHSLDIQKSFTTLLDALTPNGQLVIVDDFFDGHENTISQQLKENWHLNSLISENDIQIDDANFSISSEDLTPFMRLKSLFKIYTQRLFFRLFKKNSPYKKLFKGGVLLDHLYTKKQMKYKLLIITKNR
ncbi:MAG: class I SAM-dependent methyltransferase [Flavobacterium sp.]|uniref:class I SAM-dependent methyltransferase n=1 Tax=Flavobacterium sp. TaxID=239 RepID=UPI001DFF9681|nr:class I SAM-dependent methyltransferase [Flavobacterium sp.]